jgi:hypothetical protein
MYMGHLIDKVTAIERLQDRITDLEQRLAQLEPCQAPPKRYRDVTLWCKYVNGTLLHGDSAFAMDMPSGYRLRKIRHFIRHENKYVHSFVIEKEEPELGHKECP